MGKGRTGPRTSILSVSNRPKTNALPRSSKYLLYDALKSGGGTSKSYDARRLCGFKDIRDLFEEGGDFDKRCHFSPRQLHGMNLEKLRASALESLVLLLLTLIGNSLIQVSYKLIAFPFSSTLFLGSSDRLFKACWYIPAVHY